MVTTMLLWVAIGAIAGFTVAFAMGTNERMGYAANIFVGVVGATIGGLFMHLAGIRLTLDFTSVSILMAIIGAIVLIGLVRAARDNPV